ncbi:hypothetical protein C6568_03830 [Melaminivora suipulveris]|uniref:Uncharacterized protein n=1 Tax=Melaminivora suipulveris TaxID=2109913 RepID=A0A2R3QA18_9BURK|nr:hypothetical protein [Melaminivora suipulveris]AVO48487.1 hypothetical protein C6568_03830 [Melaminivora suipulveris]
MALQYSRHLWHDYVTGTAAELVAAGIVDAPMLPGQPGTGKTMATYMDGQRVKQGGLARGVRNETYRSIRRQGKDRYEVCMVLPSAEVERRGKQEAAAREQALMAAWQCLTHAGAPSPWIGRVGLDFAICVVRRQHLRLT